MKSTLLLTSAISLAITLTAMPVRAQTMEQECQKSSRNNAEYRNCIARRTQQEAAPLQDRACTTKACIVRLKCKDDAKGNTVCAGGGYRVVYKDAGMEVEVAIHDPSGRVTEFSKCRTCSGMDHESGPLRDATIRMAGDDIILQVPR